MTSNHRATHVLCPRLAFTTWPDDQPRHNCLAEDLSGLFQQSFLISPQQIAPNNHCHKHYPTDIDASDLRRTPKKSISTFRHGVSKSPKCPRRSQRQLSATPGTCHPSIQRRRRHRRRKLLRLRPPTSNRDRYPVPPLAKKTRKSFGKFQSPNMLRLSDRSPLRHLPHCS